MFRAAMKCWLPTHVRGTPRARAVHAEASKDAFLPSQSEDSCRAGFHVSPDGHLLTLKNVTVEDTKASFVSGRWPCTCHWGHFHLWGGLLVSRSWFPLPPKLFLYVTLRESVSCSVISDSATPWTVVCQESSVRGFLQATILEWVAIQYSSPGYLPNAGTETGSPALSLFSSVFIIRGIFFGFLFGFSIVIYLQMQNYYRGAPRNGNLGTVDNGKAEYDL